MAEPASPARLGGQGSFTHEASFNLYPVTLPVKQAPGCINLVPAPPCLSNTACPRHLAGRALEQQDRVLLSPCV